MDNQLNIIEKAGHLQQVGRYKQSLETLEGLGTPVPSFLISTYCSIYVNCNIELKQLQKARVFIDSKLAEYPILPELHYFSALVYSEKDSPKKALKSVLRAIELDSEESTYFILATLLLLELGQLKSAKKHLKIAEALSPNELGCIYARASLCVLENKFKEARQHINTGLSIHPESTIFQNLLIHLDESNRPDIKSIKSLSLDALSQNPFDSDAQESLLFSLKNENAIARFFISKGFTRYKMEWTFGRVILMILFWKGALLWGGFGLIYLLINWAGTATFYSVLRRHNKYKFILSPNAVNMSNTYLGIWAVGIIILLYLLTSDFPGKLYFGVISLFFFILLSAISYFEISTQSGKIQFVIYISTVILLLFAGPNSYMFLGIASLFFLLVYAFLFILNIAFR